MINELTTIITMVIITQKGEMLMSTLRISAKKIKAIYRFMLDKINIRSKQVSIGTGLSVATCNTLLNDMQMQGIVTGGDKISGEVGRSSVLYQIKDDHESYLAIHLVERGRKIVGIILFSATGKILNQEKREYKLVDYTLGREHDRRYYGKISWYYPDYSGNTKYSGTWNCEAL